MENRPPQDGTQHRAEPEIIPPGQPDRPSTRREARIWISIGSHGGRQMHFAKPGLFSIFMAVLLLGIVTVIVLAILLSVFLIWIPVLGALIAALILWRVVRGR